MNSTKNKEWLRYFHYSLAIHFGLLFILFGWNYFFPTQPLLISPSIQVDVIDLPNFLKNKQNIIDTTLPIQETPAPEPVEKKESSTNTDQMKIQESKQKIKEAAQSALEKIRNNLAKKEERDNKKLIEEKKKELEKFDAKFRNQLSGREINKGSSTTGIINSATNAYLGQIQDKIRSHWELPQHLQSSNLRASVRLYIDASGKPRYYFMKKSGNDIFDTLVEEALEKSKSFSPPPAELLRELQNNGMEVLFPL